MRKFEKISKEQWNEDISGFVLSTNYSDFILPKRGTKKSAGYDFVSPINMKIPAHSAKKIPTGVKASMEDDDILMIFPRSSMGFRTNIRLSNTVGIIDSDYYNNEDNEGHIWIKFFNPTDNDYQISVGDKVAQGIFLKYGIVDDEEDINISRSGGLGSTGK